MDPGFPKVRPQLKRAGASRSFGQNFPEDCMNMEIVKPGGDMHQKFHYVEPLDSMFLDLSVYLPSGSITGTVDL